MNMLKSVLLHVASLLCLSSAATAGDFGLVRTDEGNTVGQGFVVSATGTVIAHVPEIHARVILDVRGEPVPLVRRAFDGSTKLSLWEPVGNPANISFRPFEISRQSFLRPNMQPSARSLQAGGEAVNVVGAFIKAFPSPPSAERWLIGSMSNASVKSGSPLLNGCGQLEGVVFVNEGLLSQQGIRPDQRPNHVLAVPATYLRNTFNAQTSEWRVADQVCETDRLRSETLLAQAGMTDAERRLQRVAEEKAQADRLAEDARRQAEASQQLAEQERSLREAEERARLSAAEEARLAKERAASDALIVQKKAENQTRLLWAIAVASVVALVTAVALLIRRQSQRRFAEQQRSLAEERARQAQASLQDKVAEEEVRRAVPDVVLSGSLPDGWKLSLTVPAAALAADGGVLVGRNPPPPGLVINHEEVSRRHLRLRWKMDHIEVEDVGSTNGTMVNGDELKAGDRAVLRDGANLRLGELALVVQVRLVPGLAPS